MPIQILMPALSPTMTEGTLAQWLKKEGDAVSAGEVIAEIETDKATMEVEAVDEGTLGRILVSEGTEGVAVNTPIALLLEDGEDRAALDAVAAGPAPAAQPAAPEAAPAAETQTTAPAAAAPAGRVDGQRIFASPLARRLATEAGLDLAAIAGSGPHGRIVKVDIERAIKEGVGKPAPAKPEPARPAPEAPPRAAAAAAAGPDARALADAYGLPYTEVKNSNVRKTIARRLTEASQTIPHFYLTIDCEIDALLDLRKQLNARATDDGVKLSVNDLVIKAAALALRRVPGANAGWTDDAVLMFERVDVSVAVSTDEGLITPIIKEADRKGLATISAEMKDLAGRAREGKLKPEEFQGGTFTISNLGMFGIREFSAIINPPQACILAVGNGEQRPIVRDGAVAVATFMTTTLSVDHRVVDGALGARYLAAFKAIIEDPLSMML